MELNDSVVQVLGNYTLRQIDIEIADKVRSNTSIDRTIRESVRARLMVLVRRTLSKYPPDTQELTIATVLKQAEQLANSLVD